MKKVLFTGALLLQLGMAMAGNKANMVVQVRHENVKMFQQAGTSTAIIETIGTTDRVEFIRRFNKNWALVMVNGKAGYVLLSEIGQLKNTSK
jgi:hypothetical protein